MLLSIIVPVLNESESIEAVLAPLQSFRKDQLIEVIVADGGSGDSTCIKASPLADQVISTQKGRSLQMNIGADHSSGEILLFLHADTVLPNDFYALIQQLSDSKNALWGFFPVVLSGQHWLFRVIEKAMNTRSRLTSVATGDQALFVSRSLFHHAGKFPDIPLMEDVALSKCLRAVKRPCILKSPVHTSSRRWEKNGIINTVLLMWILRLQYFLGVDPRKLVNTYHGKQ